MKLKWDELGKHFYETGVDRGVLFPMGENNTYAQGVAWSGLTAINENPTGAETNSHYADNVKYLDIISAEEFGGTIEAFTYPDEWDQCNGIGHIAKGVSVAQQKRKAFGLAYRTLIGNDTDGQDYGYKIHLVYNAKASPSQKNNQTVNDNPEPSSLSWDFKTTPISISGFKPSAHIVIDSTKVDADKLAALEDMLYGTDGDTPTEPKLPMPDEVIAMFNGSVG